MMALCSLGNFMDDASLAQGGLFENMMDYFQFFLYMWFGFIYDEPLTKLSSVIALQLICCIY